MTSGASHTSTNPRAMKALCGAPIGSVIDNFDIYLPLVALAPAITYFIPATLDIQTAALISSWIFVATMVARPLGALIFGQLADAIGRRRSTLIAVGCFAVATLLMALLPGYQQVGMAAVVALNPWHRFSQGKC